MRPLPTVSRLPLAAVTALASLTVPGIAHGAEDDLPVAAEPPRVVPILVADTYYAYHDAPPNGRTATLMTTGSRHNEISVSEREQAATVNAKIAEVKTARDRQLKELDQRKTSLEQSYDEQIATQLDPIMNEGQRQ